MHVGVTRAFFVTDAAEEREAALERRLQNRIRQLKLATWPDGTVLGGPDRATGDPRAINENSAMYGSPADIEKRLEELRDVGVGYVLLNGGGSGGGARARERACGASPARSCRRLPADRARPQRAFVSLAAFATSHR